MPRPRTVPALIPDGHELLALVGGRTPGKLFLESYAACSLGEITVRDCGCRQAGDVSGCFRCSQQWMEDAELGAADFLLRQEYCDYAVKSFFEACMLFEDPEHNVLLCSVIVLSFTK